MTSRPGERRGQQPASSGNSTRPKQTRPTTATSRQQQRADQREQRVHVAAEAKRANNPPRETSGTATPRRSRSRTITATCGNIYSAQTAEQRVNILVAVKTKQPRRPRPGTRMPTNACQNAGAAALQRRLLQGGDGRHLRGPLRGPPAPDQRDAGGAGHRNHPGDPRGRQVQREVGEPACSQQPGKGRRESVAEQAAHDRGEQGDDRRTRRGPSGAPVAGWRRSGAACRARAAGRPPRTRTCWPPRTSP